MRTTFTWLVGFGCMVAMYLLKKTTDEAIAHEYSVWAPKVARMLVRIAGGVCPAKRREWEADLAFEQRVEKNAGLIEAASCFFTSPGLRLASMVQAGRLFIKTRKPATSTHAALLASVKAGRPNYEEIFLTYRPAMHKAALAVLGSVGRSREAEDVVQAAMLEVFRKELLTPKVSNIVGLLVTLTARQALETAHPPNADPRNAGE